MMVHHRTKSFHEFALHTLPKVDIGSHCTHLIQQMKVKLAVQVLSKSVAIALRKIAKEDVTGAAEFCKMMNGFFDCTNVRSLTKHVRKNNAFIKPYESAEDEHLTWLKDVFLKYLESWRQSTLRTKGETRPIHIWQLVHDAKESARKLSKETLLQMLKIVSGLPKFHQSTISSRPRFKICTTPS